MYPTHIGAHDRRKRKKKTVGRFVELGNPGPLPQPLNTSFTYKNGLLSESTYADIANAAFRGLSKAQQDALKDYTMFGSKYINPVLCEAPPDKFRKRVISPDEIDNLIAAMRNASHEIVPGTLLSRRIDFEPRDLMAIIGSTGKILQDPAFMSTSINPFTAYSGNVHMKLTIGPNVRGLYTGRGSQLEGGAISDLPSDQEILLPENTRLHIQKVEQAPKVDDDDGFGCGARYIVHAHVLPTGWVRA